MKNEIKVEFNKYLIPLIDKIKKKEILVKNRIELELENFNFVSKLIIDKIDICEKEAKAKEIFVLESKKEIELVNCINLNFEKINPGIEDIDTAQSIEDTGNGKDIKKNKVPHKIKNLKIQTEKEKVPNEKNKSLSISSKYIKDIISKKNPNSVAPAKEIKLNNDAKYKAKIDKKDKKSKKSEMNHSDKPKYKFYVIFDKNILNEFEEDVIDQNNKSNKKNKDDFPKRININKDFHKNKENVEINDLYFFKQKDKTSFFLGKKYRSNLHLDIEEDTFQKSSLRNWRRKLMQIKI